MKKSVKLLGIIGGACGALAAGRLLCAYRGMKKREAELEKNPVYRLKQRLATIQRTPEQTVVTLPNNLFFIERLRVCAKILAAKNKAAKEVSPDENGSEI